MLNQVILIGILFQLELGNDLLNFYCECEILEIATKIFSEMPKKNVISWNAIVSSLAFNGRGELRIDCLSG